MSDILQQILTKLDGMNLEIKEVKGTMATKAELQEIRETMATKAELQEIRETMATKAELQATNDELEKIRNTMATRAELKATNDELKEIKKTMATKTELLEIREILVDMDSRLGKVFDQVVRNSELISTKADKEDVNKINKRLDLHLVRISILEEELTLIKQSM